MPFLQAGLKWSQERKRPRQKRGRKQKNMKKTTLIAILGALVCNLTAATAQDTPPQPPQAPQPPHGDGHLRGPRGPLGRPSPIIGALDTNHDGVIDAEEIANASTVLATLDKNGDGKLTREEFAGGRPAGPGRISKDRIGNPEPRREGKVDGRDRQAFRRDSQDGRLQPPPPGQRGEPEFGGPRGRHGHQGPAEDLNERHDSDRNAEPNHDEVAGFQHPKDGTMPPPPRAAQPPEDNQ